MKEAEKVLIIPCYNEAKRLRPEIFRQFCVAHPEVSLLFVDDGSVDDTSERLAEFDVLRLAVNSGKAEAVRAGVLRVLSLERVPELIGFADADLATPLEEMLRLFEVLGGASGKTLVMGSRWERLGGGVHRSARRGWIGWLIACVVRCVTGMSVYDSQCGAKVFRREAAAVLFEKPFVSRWMFDVELLLRLPEGAKRALEVPLEAWEERAGSKVRLLDGVRAMFDLSRLAWYTSRNRLIQEAR